MAENSETREPIPLHFKSIAEAAEFWDSHDLADYWDQLEKADTVIQLAPALAQRIRERMKKRMLSIRLEEWQIARAKEIAKRKGIPYQQLMREWISHGIRLEGSSKRRAE